MRRIKHAKTALVIPSVAYTDWNAWLVDETGATIDLDNPTPAADFTLTQNAVVPFTSEFAAAVVNTLYLKAGKVGIGTASPANKLTIKDTNGNFSIEITDGTSNRLGIGQSNGDLVVVNPGSNYLFRFSPNLGGDVVFAGFDLTFAARNLGFRSTAGYGIGFIPNGLTTSLANAALYISSTSQVGIGTPAPAASAKLEIASTTGALLVPRMTTAEKAALTAVNGMIVYDATLNKFQGYENGAWASFI